MAGVWKDTPLWKSKVVKTKAHRTREQAVRDNDEEDFLANQEVDKQAKIAARLGLPHAQKDVEDFLKERHLRVCYLRGVGRVLGLWVPGRKQGQACGGQPSQGTEPAAEHQETPACMEPEPGQVAMFEMRALLRDQRHGEQEAVQTEEQQHGGNGKSGHQPWAQSVRHSVRRAARMYPGLFDLRAILPGEGQRPQGGL